MIKGFRFTNQLSNAEVDARIHQKILNNNDGIFYGMELSNTSNSITITEGLCEIAGRPVGVVGSETVQVNIGNFYCLLVLEIDLSKESSKEIFNQVTFKILTSSSAYPNATKQDINKINGTNKLYQLEFARFKTTASGITDFQDTRTFLDFDSIYAQIEQHIKDIDDGALFIKKSDIQVIHSRIDSTENAKTLYYPNGLDYQHCAVISIVAGENDMILSTSTSKQSMPPGTTDLRVVLQPDSIVVERTKSTIKPNSSTFFRLVLLKISEEMYSEQ